MNAQRFRAYQYIIMVVVRAHPNIVQTYASRYITRRELDTCQTRSELKNLESSTCIPAKTNQKLVGCGCMFSKPNHVCAES
jgi:hypothetical protein